jgi:hypothetical protein
MEQGLSDKLSNIIGTKLPNWLINQLGTRSNKTNQNNRDNDNILFLANKTAWVRLVSSINITDQKDRAYFKINSADDLAKDYVLFGGVSKYLNNNSYKSKAGLGKDGSYGTLGQEEISKYGYKPMPGITSVTIETQGRLGSVLAATIKFQCWDKMQLDIMDALYFKLGFTMFLEWGQTFYYLSPENKNGKNPNKILASELNSIDPFQPDLKKEDVYFKIAENRRNSEGNYDGMLGLVTNFGFLYNQDGGYDCTLRLISLGILGDSIKINNPGPLPGIVKEEITVYTNSINTISKLEEERAAAQAAKDIAAKNAEITSNLSNIQQSSIDEIIAKYYQKPTGPQSVTLTLVTSAAAAKENSGINTNINIIEEYYPSNRNADFKYANLFLEIPNYGLIYIIRKLNGFIPVSPLSISNTQIIFDYNEFSYIVNNILNNSIYDEKLWESKIFSSYDRQIDLPYSSQYNNENYKIQIVRDDFGTADPIVSGLADQRVAPTDREFAEAFLDAIKNENNKFTIKEYTKFGEFVFEFKVPFIQGRNVTKPGSILQNLPEVTVPENIVFYIPTRLTINDTRLIKSIEKPLEIGQPANIASVQKLTSQNETQTPTPEQQKRDQEEQSTQIQNALNIQSSLELILRAIQLHSLNKAINRTGNPDISIGNNVNIIKFWDKNDKTPNKKPFLEQIFSDGVYSSFIRELVNDTIDDSSYDLQAGQIKDGTQQKNLITPLQKFKIHSKYGFATALLANNTSIKNISLKKVNYKELLTSYVIPYNINQEIVKGVQVTHPVYIPFGLLLMILNHSCTIYDTADNSNFQTPLVYIDYNPELNFCLSNSKHLSTNPWKTLIPFEGTDLDYQSLFNPNLLDKSKHAILAVSGSTDSTPLFSPETKDAISGAIPKIKFSTGNSNVYRARIMNILINIDYAVQLVNDFSTKDTSNSVFLKPYIEQILSDLNKYLGNFNSFRLSYNDQGNTFQIIDDQFVPSIVEEYQINSKNIPTKGNTNTTEIPLLGKASIAKSMEIHTDVSSKLSNLIAISANSNVANKATLSKNGDPYGFINTHYVDRYIQNRQEISGSINSNTQNNSEKSAAIQFNQAITDFYSNINPSQDSVSQATSYYIEKMSKIKNTELPTRASTLIPVSINFATDGISGLSMGHGFTVSQELLPYTYAMKKASKETEDYINNVGFVVVGLTHTIENNIWTSTVKGNMIFLKDATSFTPNVTNVSGRVGQFGINLNNQTANIFSGSVDLSTIKFTSSGKSGISNVGPKGLEIGNTIAAMLGYTPEYNSIYRVSADQEALIKQGYGVKDSFHLTGNAVDVKPADWNKLSLENQAYLKNKYDVIYHNNHYHIEPK